MRTLPPEQLSRELRLGQSPDLTRRRWIVGLSLLQTVAGQMVTLFQTGIIKKLPDPPLDVFDSTKVDASNYAYQRGQQPDAPAMLVNGGLTAMLAATGGQNRAHDLRWVPVALAAKPSPTWPSPSKPAAKSGRKTKNFAFTAKWRRWPRPPANNARARYFRPRILTSRFMPRAAWVLVATLFLLGACESRQPAERPPSTMPSLQPAAVATATPAAPAPAPDTADLTRRFDRRPGPADTLVQIGSRHYRLSVQVATDSTRPVAFGPSGLVGQHFADASDSAGQRVRGYEQTYTFTLRDSARRTTIFRRQLRKKDFRRAAPEEYVTVMDMPPPSYLGYSAGLRALVFACYLGVPFSDVGHHATLLLDLRGRVQALSPGGPAYSDGADCDPRVSPSGHAVLTCTEVLRAGRPPLSLTKPHARLAAARFLTDTTLLAVYEYGDYKPVNDGETRQDDPTVTAEFSGQMELVTTPAQRRLPTAFVLGTSGRVLRAFKLEPDYGLAWDLPRFYARPTQTYYFLTQTKLVLVPKRAPGRLTELPLRALPRSGPRQRPEEKHYRLGGMTGQLDVYLDTLNSAASRYRWRPGAGADD